LQPMKLAAMEALYNGEEGAPLTVVGLLRPEGQRTCDDDAFYFKIGIPKLLSLMSFRSANAFVPGINDLVYGNEERGILSTAEKMSRGRHAIDQLGRYHEAREKGDEAAMHEVERCRLALSRAQSGEAVALVCSGDAGVYGMASPVLELAEDYPDVDVEVIAGATAAQSGSAVLGAPLAHDFAVVSLSDLLTPWEVIERRLAAVASADFCICLYNPRSRKRADRLSRAAKIMLEWKAPDTLCGWVRNIGREGQQSGMCRLSELGEIDADMFTTVFVGNADTKLVGGRMVTPRGYREIPCER